MATAKLVHCKIVPHTGMNQPDVEVVSADNAECADMRLEVHYLKGSRNPRPGDVCGTWQDGSTLYLVAPRR